MKNKIFKGFLIITLFASIIILPSRVDAAVGTLSIPSATMKQGETKTLDISVTPGVMSADGTVTSEKPECVTITDGAHFLKIDYEGKELKTVGQVTVKAVGNNCSSQLIIKEASVGSTNGNDEDRHVTFKTGTITVGESTTPTKPDDDKKDSGGAGGKTDGGETGGKTNPTSVPTPDPTPVTNKSSNANLSSLNISGYTLHPRFNKNTTSYAITVRNNIKSLNVYATPEDGNARVSVSGNKNWKVGVNNVTIRVTAADGSSKTYIIAVTRKDEDNKTPSETTNKSSDNSLTNLVVANGELKPKFSKDTTTYDVTIPNDVDKLDISYVTSDKNAKVEITNNGDFEVGKAKAVEVRVTAEDGSVKVYTINAIKSDKKADNKLSKLTIEDGKLSPKFSPDVYEYNTTVDANTKKLKIKYKKNNPDSKVEIEGNKNFKDGNNIVLVKVTDPLGFVQYYKINVNKKSNSFDLFGLKIPKWLGYLLLSLLLLLIIFLIILLVKRRKDDDSKEEPFKDDDDDDKTRVIPNIEIKPEFNFGSKNGTDDDYVESGATLNQSGRDLSDDDENDYERHNSHEHEDKKEVFDPYDDVVTKDEIMYAIDHNDKEMLKMLYDQEKLNKKKEEMKRKKEEDDN